MKLLGRQINISDFWKGYYTTTLFLGLILMYFVTIIQRKTIINFGILLIIALIVGLLTFTLNKAHYKMTYNLKSNFFPLMQNFISWGFVTCYLFVATNYYLADKDKKEYRFQIKSKSSMAADRKGDARLPTATIDYFDFDKELVFNSEDYGLLIKSDSVKIQIKKGALGFDIICDYKLMIEI